MKITLILLAILDFTIGVFFGSVGHFYSILCFPLIAVLRGYLVVNHGRNRTLKHAFLMTAIGAFVFFAGMFIGLLIFTYKIPYDKQNEYMTPDAISQAFTYSVFSSIGYVAIYIWLGFLSAFLCRESTSITKILDHLSGSRKGHKEV